MRKIDRQESWWQPAGGNFRFAVGTQIGERRRITAASLPRGVDLMPTDGCETVIGCDEHVCRTAERRIGSYEIEKLLQVRIGVGDAGAGGRAVDAGLQFVEAVTLVVLGPVGIARPEKQDEGLSAAYKRREDGFSRGVREPLLLTNVCHECTGCGGGSRRLLTRRRRLAQAGSRQRAQDLGRHGNAARGARAVIENNRLGYCEMTVGRLQKGDVLDRYGPQLADRRCVEFVFPR